MPKLTIQVIKNYQARVQKLRDTNTFIWANFQAIGKELRDTYGLTDREALAILNNRSDEILDILQRKEGEVDG